MPSWERLTTLPALPTSFVGREREIEEVTTMLLSPETRLVTLTGPGGIGKTRLAIHATERVARAFSGRGYAYI